MSFSLRKDRTGGLVPPVGESKQSELVQPSESKVAPKPQEAAPPVVKAPPNVQAEPQFVKPPEPPAPVGPVPTPKETTPKAPPSSSMVHEGKTYYCAECGVMLQYAYGPLRLIHPDHSKCSMSYVESKPMTIDLAVIKG